MFHNYVHVEIEVDKQTDIWVNNQRAIQQKLIKKHLIVFHNDRQEKYKQICKLYPINHLLHYLKTYNYILYYKLTNHFKYFVFSKMFFMNFFIYFK